MKAFVFNIFFVTILSTAFSQNDKVKNIIEKINDSTAVIQLENHYKALYNLKSKTILVDSIIDYSLLANVESIVAKVDYKVNGFDPSTGEEGYFLNSDYYIFNYKGDKISPEKIYLLQIVSPSGEEYYLLPTCSKDNLCIILENKSEQKGVISRDGKIILPFIYKEINLSENEEYLIATTFLDEVKKFSKTGEPR
jgi:hypothetical protein